MTKLDCSAIQKLPLTCRGTAIFAVPFVFKPLIPDEEPEDDAWHNSQLYRLPWSPQH